MCTGAETMLLSAAMTTAGTMMQQDAADDAAKKQQQILAQGEEENQKINKAGEESVNEFAEKTFGAESRDQRYEDVASQREKTLADSLLEASAGASNGATGNVSSDFLGGQRTAQADSAAEGARRAKLLARTGAGGLMYGQESMMGGNLASDLAGLAQKSRRNANYTQNAAGAVRNDGSLAGGLLSGLGAAGMTAGGQAGLSSLGTKLKYAGSSTNPSAGNYMNSFDRMK